MIMMGGFVSSQLACHKCNHFNQCVNTAINYPGSKVRCIHFGYIEQLTNDTIKMVQDQMNECLYEYMNNLIGRKEN